MSDLQAKIKQLNEKAKQLNSVRQKNLGRKEALIKQQQEAISAYNAKYGTNITADDVKAEYERVMTEKYQEAQCLEQIIDAIARGDYDSANQLAGVDVAVTENVSATANEEYVKKVVEESVGATEQVDTPNIHNEGNAKMASQAQAFAEAFNMSGDLSGIKGATPVSGEPMKEMEGAKKAEPFTPSPLGNPLNVETGEVSGIPKDSVFARDFTKSDDDVMPPVAPPIGAFGTGNGKMPQAPIAPLSSLM